ncbi:MAG: thermonuclease family protein [Methylophilaceae bacterium]|nr:thermonuclease family protein [Methylophilaceae bacterium]
MKILIPLITIFFSFSIDAKELIGQVIKVVDGDTITILDANKEQFKIRLSGIDAPEKKQAFGNVSKQSLSEMIAGKEVTIDYNKRGRYGRIIGKVLLDSKDINLEQVKRGLAWHYKQYEREQEVGDRALYAQEEYLAQKDNLGLWKDKNPIPPWDFRKIPH